MCAVTTSGSAKMVWENIPPTVTVDSSKTIASEVGQWFGRATIKRLASGILVLCYREGPSHSTSGLAEIHIRFSDDNGDTWSDEDKYLDDSPITGFPMNPDPRNEDEEANSPWLYLAPNGNLILHMWRVSYGVSMNGTYQSVSTDGGETWGATSAIDFDGIADDLKTFSTNDDFVLDGVIYAIAITYLDLGEDEGQASLIKSEDNGANWAKVSTICDFAEGPEGTGACEGGLEYLGNNKIIAVLRHAGAKATLQRFSDDLGQTWGDLKDWQLAFTVCSRHRVYTRAHLKGEANWWEDPVLIMCGFVHTTYGSGFPRRNAIWVSKNRGAAWFGPYYVDDETGDAGYGDLFYDSTNDQYVLVSYQGTVDEAVLEQYNLTISGI